MIVKQFLKILVLIMVVSFLFPMMSSYAGNLKGNDVFTDIKKIAIQEFLKANPGIEKKDVTAYASKLFNEKLNSNNGIYLVEVAEEKYTGKSVELKNVTAYKVEIKSNEKNIFLASIEEILYSIEMKHRICSTADKKIAKEQIQDAFNEFCRSSCRAFKIITAENVFTLAKNVDDYVKYVGSKNVPASHAFYALTSSIENKIKTVLLDSNLNSEIISVLKEKLENLNNLLSSLNKKAVSAQPSVSKHYDPAHPGHLHQSSNGTLYHQPGDNGPFSNGSYPGHSGNYHNHNSYNNHHYPEHNYNHNHNHDHYNYNSYPSTYYPSNNYPSYPYNYYPAQYPQYPPSNYYPSHYSPSNYYPSYSGQIEHIHHCSRCGRQFSYYPNGYNIVCPYCGHAGY